jgi:hypothetical protein
VTDQASTSYTSTPPEQRKPEREPSSVAIGFTIFAGSMMILAGAFQAIQGVSALFNDEVFVSVQDYVFKFDITAWGWIHLGIGLLVLLAGFGVVAGMLVARIVGITLAGLSAIVNFLAIPYYPFWALTIIAIDVFVIWALALHGRDIKSDQW